MMKIVQNFFFAGMAAALMAGCATHEPQPSSMDAARTNDVIAAPARFYVMPAPVTRVIWEYRFVVLDFRSRLMPPVGTKLNVYRGTNHVGAVQITEPVRTRYATADILTGDIQMGDEAR
jgi:hypothetical protein